MVKSTRNKGLIVLGLSLVFVILLTLFMVSELAPVTEARIADCESRIKAIQESSELTNEEEDLKTDYEEKISMLENRAKYYSIAMLFVGALLLAGFIYYMFADVYFAAPLSALGILLAIGISFRCIISFEMKDVLLLVVSVAAGFVVYFVCKRMTTMNNKIFYALCGSVILLLIINLIFGDPPEGVKEGARLWLNVFGVSIQPGEIIKFLLVMIGAYSYGNNKRIMLYYGTSLFSCFTLLALKDLGTASIIFTLALMMTILLLDSIKMFLVCIIMAVGAVVVAVLMFDYVRERFMNFGNAMDNPASQQAQLLKAVVFGGIGGLGISNSSYIINIFAIDTDMVVAGIASVFGVGMLLVVMLCYSVLVLLPRKNAAVYPWAYYVTTQASVAIVVQVLLNFLGSMDIIPFTGVVAPFLSSGGSATLTYCMIFGLVFAALNPKIVPLAKQKQEG